VQTDIICLISLRRGYFLAEIIAYGDVGRFRLTAPPMQVETPAVRWWANRIVLRISLLCGVYTVADMDVSMGRYRLLQCILTRQVLNSFILLVYLQILYLRFVLCFFKLLFVLALPSVYGSPLSN
jgi:hypothetical protein